MDENQTNENVFEANDEQERRKILSTDGVEVNHKEVENVTNEEKRLREREEVSANSASEIANSEKPIEKLNGAVKSEVKQTEERDKGFSLLMYGSDDEVTEYFAQFGVPKEEILKERNELAKQAKDELYTKDLESLQNEFEFITANSIKEIPNFEKFALLRASGLSAIESFEGASGKLIAMEYLKNQDSGSYAHLKSSGLKGSATGDIPIPKDEVEIWKSAFPKDSLTQLTKRYNKTKFQKGE